MVIGLKERDMCKVSGEDREGLIRDDALLFVVPLPHLLTSYIGCLPDLF
jgi:hypothetical protein